MQVNQTSLEKQRDALGREAMRNEASLRIAVGRCSFESHVAVSTPGLLAIGGMVASILLSAAVIVLVSTRKLPEGTLPNGMRRS